jgi:phage-related holin
MDNSSKVLLFSLIIAAVCYIITGFIREGTGFSLQSRGAGQGIVQLFIVFLAIVMIIISLVMHFLNTSSRVQ